MIVPTSNGGSQTTSSSASTRPSARRTPPACSNASWIAPPQATRARLHDAPRSPVRRATLGPLLGDEAVLEPAEAVDLDRDLLAGAHARRADGRRRASARRRAASVMNSLTSASSRAAGRMPVVAAGLVHGDAVDDDADRQRIGIDDASHGTQRRRSGRSRRGP